MPQKSHRKLFAAERYMMEKRGVKPARHVEPTANTQDVLEALAEIKDLIVQAGARADAVAADADATTHAENLPELSVLRGQLTDLKGSIDKTKSEIAALHKPGEADDKFTTAAMELGAIVQATEEATNNILGAGEDIEDFVQTIKERVTDIKSHDHLDSISNLVITIFENCNFQDITGQRINKVVKTINYLEERILTMINIWGEDEFSGIEMGEDARSEDEKLLEGPQLDGQGISQDDIDALFD